VNDLQKTGGIAALVNAVAYLVGIGLVMTFLAPIMDAKPEQYVAFMANNQTLLFVWHLLIYLVAGVFMIPLALALHARLKDKAPALMQITTAFGLIWATTVICSGMVIINDLKVVTNLYNQDPTRATTVYLALSAVEEGLGGAIELPGGLWILLVSWVALKSNQFPKWLNFLGAVIGLSGIATLIPSLDDASYVFGLGAILWFFGVGIALLLDLQIRQPSPEPIRT
jgi:glycopeptide antibiotics resistance protein